MRCLCDAPGGAGAGAGAGARQPGEAPSRAAALAGREQNGTLGASDRGGRGRGAPLPTLQHAGRSPPYFSALGIRGRLPSPDLELLDQPPGNWQVPAVGKDPPCDRRGHSNGPRPERPGVAREERRPWPECGQGLFLSGDLLKPDQWEDALMSTAAPQDEKKKELLAELEKTKQAARWVRIRAQEWVGKGQHAEDLAEAVGNYVENIPDDSYKPRESWDRQIEDWRKVNEDFTNVNEMFMGVWGSLPNFPATVSSAGGFMSEETFLKLLPLNVRPEVTKATERFVEVAERAAPFQEATREMVRLGLDVAPPNQESAVSLLQEAWDAFEKSES